MENMPLNRSETLYMAKVQDILIDISNRNTETNFYLMRIEISGMMKHGHHEDFFFGLSYETRYFGTYASKYLCVKYI